MNLSLKQKIPQLRIAVNSRCGRACIYCRPSGEGVPTAGGMNLRSDEVVRLGQSYHRLGGKSLKLTGGDPALWSGLEAAVKGIKESCHGLHLEIISRHPNLIHVAPALAANKVDLVNFSVDTLSPRIHRMITGVDDLHALVETIQAVARFGLAVKINMVVMNGINVEEINSIIAFCEDNGVRELKLLDVIRDLDNGEETHARRLAALLGRTLEDLYFPLSELKPVLVGRAARCETAWQGDLGHPMKVYVLNSGLRILTKDHTEGAWYGSICKGCSFYPCHDALMALRVTADRRLQFCLLRGDLCKDLSPALEDNDDRLDAFLSEAIGTYSTAKMTTPTTYTLKA